MRSTSVSENMAELCLGLGLGYSFDYYSLYSITAIHCAISMHDDAQRDDPKLPSLPHILYVVIYAPLVHSNYTLPMALNETKGKEDKMSLCPLTEGCIV